VRGKFLKRFCSTSLPVNYGSNRGFFYHWKKIQNVSGANVSGNSEENEIFGGAKFSSTFFSFRLDAKNYFVI
jgi:hypothetical protein